MSILEKDLSRASSKKKDINNNSQKFWKQKFEELFQEKKK
jgi:hypothetical protein